METTLTFENETTEPYVGVAVTMNGKRETFVLDVDSQPGERYETAIRVGVDAVVEVRGAVAAPVTEYVEPDRSISVSIVMGQEDALHLRTVYQRQLAYTVDGPVLRILFPGVVLVNELSAEPLTVQGT